MDRFDQLLSQQINRTLQRGALFSAMLGLGCAMLIAILEVLGLVKGMWVPALWAGLCGLYSLLPYFLARARLMRGPVTYAVFLPFISLPSLLFLLSAWLLPAGAATFISGPAYYLYFFVLIMAGFLFNRRLCFWGGLLVGAQYLWAYWAARHQLAAIRAPDPLMAQDLTAAPIYMFKFIIMAFAGLVMGVLCRHTRSLVGSLLKQEQEQQRIKDAFGKYVSAEIRDEVLAGRVPLDGEMKDVTVLFADLRDFKPLTSSHDPKEVVKVMNGYFSAMAAAIREQGGLVLQYIGDEIYAVFGAPLDQVDHPGRAFAAAREMSRRLEELNRSLAGAGHPTLAHGIGLHSGEALAANLGSPERLSYLLVGETVNLASRLQGLCKKLGVEVVVSAETARRLPGEQKERAPLSPLPAQQVKGFPRPLEVFTPAAA